MLLSSHLSRALFLLIAVAFGCNGLVEPTINLAIPDDFSGPILILEDNTAKDYSEMQLSYQVEIPQSGVLFVKSVSFLRKSASWKVHRKNGNLVPLEFEATDGQVAMRFGGWRSWNSGPGRLEHFVGTLADFEKCDFSLIPSPINK